MRNFFILLIFLSVISASKTSANEKSWLEERKIAISLSYDDALISQLHNAIPALNQRGLKASFYIAPLSDAFQNRLSEWRQLAKQGHELGNHTLFHSCSRSKPGREWIQLANNLDDKSVATMIKEVKLGNTLLTALDGLTERTFTPPCFDQVVSDGNYINAIESMFIGIKSTESPTFAALISPSNMSSNQIIDFIEKQPRNIKLINVLFHGVGGDHLATSTLEHEKF